MSLYAALFSGVSGLSANSSALGAISDNITNVNTVGYKAVNAEFSTLVTEARSNTNYSPGGVAAKVRSLIGKQGLIQASASNTDLSVDGNGFFVVKTTPVSAEGEVRFTRAGSFRPDSEGFLQNTSGLYLYGWPLQSDGTFLNDGDVDKLGPISTAGLTGTAESTTSVKIRANLQSSITPNPLAATYVASTPANNMASGTVTPDFKRSVQVFDAQGGTHTVTMAYLKHPTLPNRWFAEVYAEPASDVTTGPGLVNGQLAAGTIAFNSDGSFDAVNSTASLSTLAAAWTNGASSSNISLAFGTNGDVDGLTQFDSISTMISSSVDGAVFGNVTGVSIGKDGIVTALFDNGLARQVYKLPIATFQNPDGLTRLQGNAYGVSDQSGTFSLVEPGTGGGGTIAPSTLEASTVDLATEFTKLITTQRAFSASTRVITTADEMLNELNQVKR